MASNKEAQPPQDYEERETEIELAILPEHMGNETIAKQNGVSY